MFRFILKRLVSGLIILFLFQTAIFFVVQVVLPGDFASHFTLMLSNQEIIEFREQLGLDLPLWQSYINWLGNLVRGDLGLTYSLWGSGESVLAVIQRVAPPTILVFGVGTALAFLLGQWLGKVTAWKGTGLASGLVTFSGIALYTSFPPWLAFLLVYFLSTQLGLLPRLMSNRLWQEAPFSSSEIMMRMVLALLAVLAMIFLLNMIIRRVMRTALPAILFVLLAAIGWVASWHWGGILPYAVDIAKAASLPLIGYVLLSFGEIMLIMRTSMFDVMHEQYVHTAFAKGLTSQAVRDRHVARNAILPVLSALVIRLPYLFTGAVMLERALNWQGIGTELFMAVGLQNILLVMGLVLVIGVISLVARLILDILQVMMDPRIHLGAGQLKGL